MLAVPMTPQRTGRAGAAHIRLVAEPFRAQAVLSSDPRTFSTPDGAVSRGCYN
jgi:hypothetical protein